MPPQSAAPMVLAPRMIAIVLLVVAYAAFGAWLEPRTWPAAIAVLLPTGVIALISLHRFEPSDEPASPPTRRGVWIWSAVIMVGLLWKAWAFFHQPAWDVADHDYPTLSVLVRPALEHEVVRLAAWVTWLYAGLRLVRP